MAKYVLLIIAFIIVPFALAQENVTITTYYPAPIGVYENLRLFPSDALPLCDAAHPDNEGFIHYDNVNNLLRVCREISPGVFSWQAAGSHWTQNPGTTDLFTNNPAWNVGIGTDNPATRLDVAGGLKAGAVDNNLCGNGINNDIDDGIIRYNRDRHEYEYCDGNNWKIFQSVNTEVIASGEILTPYNMFVIGAGGAHINRKKELRIPGWTNVTGGTVSNNALRVNFADEDKGAGIYFLEWGANVEIDNIEEAFLLTRLKYNTAGSTPRILQREDASESEPNEDSPRDYLPVPREVVEVNGVASVYVSRKPYVFYITGQNSTRKNSRVEATVKNAYIRIFKIVSF